MGPNGTKTFDKLYGQLVSLKTFRSSNWFQTDFFTGLKWFLFETFLVTDTLER